MLLLKEKNQNGLLVLHAYKPSLSYMFLWGNDGFSDINKVSVRSHINYIVMTTKSIPSNLHELNESHYLPVGCKLDYKIFIIHRGCYFCLD